MSDVVHLATATKELTRNGDKEPKVWWRGRCQCGHSTSVKFHHEHTARMAVERIHIQPIREGADA